MYIWKKNLHKIKCGSFPNLTRDAITKFKIKVFFPYLKFTEKQDKNRSNLTLNKIILLENIRAFISYLNQNFKQLKVWFFSCKNFPEYPNLYISFENMRSQTTTIQKQKSSKEFKIRNLYTKHSKRCFLICKYGKHVTF